MNDVSQNILNDRHEPHKPTHSEVREWATEQLQNGLDPDRGRRKHTPCPDCETRVVTGVEKVGPDVAGFEETLSKISDLYSGEFTAEEFAEVARTAFEAALDDVLDDEETTLDEDAHRTLNSFEGDEARLAFDKDLIAPLLSGEKTATVRYDLEPRCLDAGTRVLIVTCGRKSPVAVAYVEDIIRTDLSDALRVIEDRGYQHTESRVVDLWKALENYYDDALGLSTTVSVVLLDDITTVGT